MNEINVLIVEDDFLNRRLIKKTLTDNYYNVFEAKTASEALSLLEKKNIDALILDINLGENEDNGITLGKHIKDKYNIPFIYLTAYETKDIIAKAITTTPVAYLTKPFKNADLIASIELATQKITLPNEVVYFIIVKDGDYNVKLPVKEIDYAETEGNYLLIHSTRKTYKYRSTIKQLLDILPPKVFMQTHRAFIVNKEKIDMFSSRCLLIGNAAIPVSKNYIADIQAVYQLPDSSDA